jgi:hypothetical protein
MARFTYQLGEMHWLESESKILTQAVAGTTAPRALKVAQALCFCVENGQSG